MAKGRTALLVRCSAEEAEAIRQAAQRERRTISGYILHAVLNRIAYQKKLEAEWQKTGKRKAVAGRKSLDKQSN